MMAPCNSIHTKTWAFEYTTFALKCGQNGLDAKAHSQSQRRIQPRTKAIQDVGTTNEILHSLCDVSKVVYYLYNIAL